MNHLYFDHYHWKPRQADKSQSLSVFVHVWDALEHVCVCVYTHAYILRENIFSSA